MVLLSSLISGLCMWLVLWLLTRREDRVHLMPVLLISLGSCVLTYFALRFLGAWGIGVVMISLIFALVHWICLSWIKSIVTALAWLVSQICFGLFVAPVF